MHYFTIILINIKKKLYSSNVFCQDERFEQIPTGFYGSKGRRKSTIKSNGAETFSGPAMQL